GTLTTTNAGSSEPSNWPDLATWPPTNATPIDVVNHYPNMAQAGYGYGPMFQGLRAAWRRGDEVFAEVALPDEASEHGRYGIHPALLDAATHPLGLPELFGADQPRLPFAWTGISLLAAGATTVRLRLTPSGADAVAVTIADGAGRPVMEAESLVVRPVSTEHLERMRSREQLALLRLEWNPVLAIKDSAPSRWFVLGTESTPVAAVLSATGTSTETMPDLAAASDAIGKGAPPPDAIVLSCLGEPALDQEMVGQDPAAVYAAVSRVLHLVQTWLADSRWASTRLVVLTNGAVSTSADEDIIDLAHAPLWGLIRSAQAEHPNRMLLLDIDHPDGAALLPAAVGAGEPQLAARRGRLLAPRIAQTSRDALTPPTRAPWRLDTQEAGTIDGLSLIACPEVTRPLQPGQVRIAVHAAGLNFRDALMALGLYPGEAVLGSEAAGVVTDVGDGVDGLHIGDRVMGLVPHAFGPIAVTDHRMLVRIPIGWSFEHAAAVPVAFLTAYYGLFVLARLQEGESVLVHAAAGGVGMAAVQLAQHAGADVFATASPAKWDTLRSLGLDDLRIASSRTQEFEQRFIAASGGRGVDVVLNSLTGEFIDSSARLLPRGGQFIEMGKADVRDARLFTDQHPGVAYQTFDLMQAGPDRIQHMLTHIVTMLDEGNLQPLPVTTWGIRDAKQAFRFISQARHVGKIVLRVPPPINPSGTVLITGGTGQLGGLVARHLVAAHGAQHLILASRRGIDADGAAQLQAELAGLGAEVTVAACDAADRHALARLLTHIPAQHPLTAVIHTAGVISDGVIESLTDEQLATVLRPKVDAVISLHQLTQDSDLAAFVMFSSASGVIGSPGQSNYAAANTYLDALAAHRHTSGRPATSIAWGLWAQDGGMAGHLQHSDLARMSRTGMSALTTEQALDLFDAAIVSGESTVVAARLDVARLRAQATAGTLSTILRGLAGAPARATAATDTDTDSLVRRLTTASEPEQHRILLDLVRDHAATVLGHPTTDDVVADRGFIDLGFDSLTAIELRNRIATATQAHLPATLIFDHPTPAALASYLGTHLTGQPNGAPDTGADPAEAEIRHAMATIPLSVIRQAGILDTLLQLAGHDGTTPPQSPKSGDVEIDGMDISDLIRLANDTDTDTDNGSARAEEWSSR
ncbi:SDR family NAD(P)-dependent oxidoreductase, partial [Micromonospora sp. NPDC049204]